MRQVPVAVSRSGLTIVVVVARGRQAAFARNIEADPHEGAMVEGHSRSRTSGCGFPRLCRSLRAERGASLSQRLPSAPDQGRIKDRERRLTVCSTQALAIIVSLVQVIDG
jgi:hypothetical protein